MTFLPAAARGEKGLTRRPRRSSVRRRPQDPRQTPIIRKSKMFHRSSCPAASTAAAEHPSPRIRSKANRQEQQPPQNGPPCQPHRLVRQYRTGPPPQNGHCPAASAATPHPPERRQGRYSGQRPGQQQPAASAAAATGRPSPAPHPPGRRQPQNRPAPRSINSVGRKDSRATPLYPPGRPKHPPTRRPELAPKRPSLTAAPGWRRDPAGSRPPPPTPSPRPPPGSPPRSCG